MYHDFEFLAICSISYPDIDNARAVIDYRNSILAWSKDRSMDASFLRIHPLSIVANQEVPVALANHMKMPMLVVGQRLMDARLGRAEMEGLGLDDGVCGRVDGVQHVWGIAA